MAGSVRRSPTADLARAVRHLRRGDPRLAGLIERIGPCRLHVDRSGTLFTALAEAIVYQQVTGRAAATVYGRLRRACGRRHPRPQDVQALSDAALRSAGLSRQKIAALRDLAAHTRDGLGRRKLARLDDEAVVEAVTVVRGIGRWTAEILLMFRLGRRDVLPVGDYGIRKAMQRLYRLPDLPDPDRMRVLAEPWRPYRSVACWYLWRSLGGAAGRAEPAG